MERRNRFIRGDDSPRRVLGIGGGGAPVGYVGGAPI
jgi:hypothetical protein